MRRVQVTDLTVLRERTCLLPAGRRPIRLIAAAYLVVGSAWAKPQELQEPPPPTAQAKPVSDGRAAHGLGWPSVRLAALELVPSPLLVVGSEGAGFGVRWQVTPFAYSFGITERRYRYFLVSPVARHVGALEFYLSPEWTCCIRAGESGWLGRLGTRLYLPAVGRGEVLAVSLGASYTYENRRHGGAAELGIYTLSSIVGLTLTVAPWLAARETMLALSLRYY